MGPGTLPGLVYGTWYIPRVGLWDLVHSQGLFMGPGTFLGLVYGTWYSPGARAGWFVGPGSIRGLVYMGPGSV